jgi:hypothetical protein
VAQAVRVRVYWSDGRIETVRQPIDSEVTMIVRQDKDGTHRHFEVTDELDAEGYVIALEMDDEP